MERIRAWGSRLAASELFATLVTLAIWGVVCAALAAAR